MTVDDLAELVRRRYPSATVTVDHLPSGVAMLDARVGNRLFVAESHPTHGVGVDEALKDEGFDMGYHHVFAEIFGASVCLLGLLDGAGTPRAVPGVPAASKAV